MPSFTINANKSINSHNRNNLIINDRSIFIYKTNKHPDFDPANDPNDIFINYNKELIVQNPETIVSPDFTLKTKDTLSILHPVHFDFGIPNTIQYVSCPPNFVQYPFGLGEY